MKPFKWYQKLLIFLLVITVGFLFKFDNVYSYYRYIDILQNENLYKLEYSLCDPIGYNENYLIYNIQPMWNAGNKSYRYYNNSTHQFIADRAFMYVASRFPHVFGSLPPVHRKVNSTNYTGTTWANVVWYTNWSDAHERDTIGPLNTPTFSSHFYYVPTSGNLLGSNGPNAKDRFMQHYNAAINLYRSNRHIEAFRRLGKALHYISDMAAPVHTGYQRLGIIHDWINGPWLLANHQNFEERAIARQEMAIPQNFRFNPHNWNEPMSVLLHRLVRVSFRDYDSNFLGLGEVEFNWRVDLALEAAVNANAAVLIQFANTVSPHRCTSGPLTSAWNEAGHFRECTHMYCGRTFLEPHNMIPTGTGIFRCTICGFTSRFMFVPNDPWSIFDLISSNPVDHRSHLYC
ncbi:MAG: hypothetical protein FWE36_00330 [Erysipelotrichales bacterium]|nr:hypothetical protein [Erysipelotrichales bacterium]